MGKKGLSPISQLWEKRDSPYFPTRMRSFFSQYASATKNPRVPQQIRGSRNNHNETCAPYD